MLLKRSILLQASLLLSACIVNGQRYNSEYEVSDGDDGDHHSSYTGDSDKPDYSSYYKTDVSAPLITTPVQGNAESGFNPVEFSSFFSSPHFDFGSASSKQEIHKPIIPLVQETKAAAAGFVNPVNFQTGFTNVGADPFSRDFFEQSAQQQQHQTLQEESNDEAETRPGPNYISHRVPVPKETLKTYATEVHDLKRSPENYKNYRRESIEDDDEEKENLEDDKEEINKAEEEDEEVEAEEKPAKYNKPNSYDFDVKHLSNYNLPEYNEKEAIKEEGKSSYNAPADSPFLPHYYTKYTHAAAQPTLSPYQKYSFQPANDEFGLKTGYLEAIQSTLAPFNPAYSKVAEASNVYEKQAAEIIPKTVNGKKCKLVNKDVTATDIKTGRFKRQAMNCYVCEDPKNGANYEQCSYNSDPNTKSYFVGKAEKYSKPITPESFRYKRYTDKQHKEEDEEEEKGEYVNPYDYVKSKSHKYYSKPDDFAQSYYNPKEFGSAEEYRFPQEYFNGEEKEKSESELVSEELVKNGENCKKIKKETMTCMVCTNPKTGGNYEQCSYTSAPAEKKYAYVRERKFDENENPIEDKVVESSEPKEVVQEETLARRPYKTRNPKKEKISASYSAEDSPNRRHDESLRTSSRKSKPQSRRRFYSDERAPEETKRREVEHSSYEVPDHFIESTTRREKAGVRGLDPELYGSDDSSEYKEKREKKPYEKEVEDYHYKLFPQRNEESESKNQEKRVRADKPYDYEEDNKKDVEAVLAEFAKKDRSHCKKAHKNGMTCYLCLDKNGIKNEECMFVSESQPQSSHVAYHEMKKVKSPEEDENVEGEEAESNQKLVKQELKGDSAKKRRLTKKFTTPSPIDVAAEPSRETSTRVRSTTAIPPSINKPRVPRKLRRTKNLPKDAVVEESRRRERKVKAEEADPTLKTPKEFDVGEEDGAYTALETKPVYSKVLGVTLPKYMVDVSEYEKTFDEESRPH